MVGFDISEAFRSGKWKVMPEWKDRTVRALPAADTSGGRLEKV